MRVHEKHVEKTLELWCAVVTAALLAAAFLGALYTGELSTLWTDFVRLQLTPSPVLTDYFELGSLGASFLNAAVCGAGVILLARALEVPFRPLMTVCYILVVAHCFFGMNFVNLSVCVAGVLVASKIRKADMRHDIASALFTGCLGPFMGEMLFRYTLGDAFDPTSPVVTAGSLALTAALALFIGFMVPAVLHGVRQMHKGYSLYNAGVAIGLLAMFLYGMMYKVFHVENPEVVTRYNAAYEAAGRSYPVFVVGFYTILFASALIIGWYQNGKSFKGYGELVKHTGYDADFVHEFGTPLCLINVGVYGFMILAFMTVMSHMPGAVGFTGPTCGIIIGAMSFVLMGQDPGDVWPIMLGYVILGTFNSAVRHDPVFVTATQPYLISFAFATGLCPIAGTYGWKWGAAAGFISGCIFTQKAATHGGLMLFNGGFAAGLTAMILIPVIEFYHIKFRE